MHLDGKSQYRSFAQCLYLIFPLRKIKCCTLELGITLYFLNTFLLSKFQSSACDQSKKEELRLVGDRMHCLILGEPMKNIA